MAEMPFPAVTLEAKNVPVCCHGEEAMSDLYTTLLNCTSRKFKVDDTTDVERADQHCLDLGFDIYGFFGLGEFLDLRSMDWRLALGSY
jgi:hypothetical protein